MGYHINLSKIGIDQYQEMLESKALVPSRLLLRDHIGSRFEQIKGQGITNLKELLDSLKNKKKLKEFSEKANLSEEYLTILNREIKSKLSKPNKFRDFAILEEDVISRLEKQGVKNSKHIFEKVLTPQNRKDFSTQTGIDEANILKLTQLTDLSRIRWVNHTFALVLYKTGYDTAKKVAEADFGEMYERILELNKKENLYKGNIGLKDMKMTVEAAQEVPLDIVY